MRGQLTSIETIAQRADQALLSRSSAMYRNKTTLNAAAYCINKIETFLLVLLRASARRRRKSRRTRA